jgi:hypothetical protein
MPSLVNPLSSTRPIPSTRPNVSKVTTRDLPFFRDTALIDQLNWVEAASSITFARMAALGAFRP